MAEARTFPKNAVIVTPKATMHVTIDPFKNRDTDEIEHYSVSIGSRKSKCVHITVPGISNTASEGKLNWVSKIVPECYLTAKDNTKLSQHILNLAFTLARDINPACTRYLLDDCSSFPCLLPNGKKQIIPLKPFYIAFHGKTWYEYYFGAQMLHNHETYMRLKLNMYDSAKKPAFFSFNNSELDEILRPLYESSNTWHTFFQAIQTTYGDKKCSVVYPWITDALYLIFDNSNMYDTHKWVIDFETNSEQALTPMISFHAYADLQTGGGRTVTRKVRATTRTPPIYVRNYYEINNFKYKQFLS
jgi:hypothetical protein